MTSIAGIVFQGPTTPTDHSIAAMLGAMPGHRGGPRATARIGSALFGRTLSIKLPEDDHDRQPVIIGDLMLVGDVRLDNRSELAAELEAGQSRLADSDILLLCWARWSQGCLQRIRGDFAFAVHDRSTGTSWLARDPASRRAMHFALVGDTLVFATMPGAILASGLVEPKFDLERLATQAMGFAAVTRRTPFREISTLLGGEIACIRDGQLKVDRYWKPETSLLSLTDAEADDRYRSLMRRAVTAMSRRHGGRLGVHLSSGFDSCSVAAFASKGRPEDRPVAYTSAPRADYDGDSVRHRLSDESGLATLTANHLGIRHRIVRASGGALAMLRRDARIVQEPDRNAINQPWWQQIHAQAKADDVTTMLTGSLGNLSIHYGGLQSLAEWRQVRGWLPWLRQALAARRIATVRWRGILFSSFKSVLPAPVVSLFERLFRQADATESISFALPKWQAVRADAEQREHRFFFAGSTHEQRLRLIQMSDFSLHHHGGLAVFGIDERDPTADRELVEFSLRLPPEQLIKDGVGRPMMRRVLADMLPREVMNNPYRGQQTADWHEHLDPAEALAMVDEFEASPTLRELVDFQKLRRAIADWPSGDWGSNRVTTLYRRMIPLTLSLAAFVVEFEAMMASGDYRHPCP